MKRWAETTKKITAEGVYPTVAGLGRHKRLSWNESNPTGNGSALGTEILGEVEAAPP